MNQQASGKSFGQGREKGLAYFSLLSELKVVAGQMETSPPALPGWREKGVQLHHTEPTFIEAWRC